MNCNSSFSFGEMYPKNNFEFFLKIGGVALIQMRTLILDLIHVFVSYLLNM